MQYGNTHVLIGGIAGTVLDVFRKSISEGHLFGRGKDVGCNHVTIRYGINDWSIDGIRTYLANQTPFEALLEDVEVFSPSVASEGACPIVVRVVAPDLERMNSEIGEYGNFIPPSFDSYKPHTTLAFVNPELADQYKTLHMLKAKFPVNSAIISLPDGYMEEVIFNGSDFSSQTFR